MNLVASFGEMILDEDIPHFRMLPKNGGSLPQFDRFINPHFLMIARAPLTLPHFKVFFWFIIFLRNAFSMMLAKINVVL